MDLNTLASRILMSEVVDLEAAGFEYRKGKGADDIAKAVNKAKKHGHAKRRHEISMLEAYLGGVVKYLRAPKGESSALREVRTVPEPMSVSKAMVEARATERECSMSEANTSLKEERDCQYRTQLLAFVDSATEIDQLKQVLKILITRSI